MYHPVPEQYPRIGHLDITLEERLHASRTMTLEETSDFISTAPQLKELVAIMSFSLMVAKYWGF